MSSFKAIIQSYIRAGFALLPLHGPSDRNGLVCNCGSTNCRSPAKHPIARFAPNGLKDATHDLDQIEKWLGGYSPPNIGIATGRISNIVVLDIDPRHGGDETLRKLENKNGSLPLTSRFNTGGGGQHILFRHPGIHIPNSAGKIGTGIDLRGDGGYIVAPPSVHISGRCYEVAEGTVEDLAPLPPWLIEGSQPRATDRPKLDWQGLSIVPEGQRNDNIAKVAGMLLGKGIDPHFCLALVLSFNNSHCSPPLDDDEVARTVASIASRELAKRGGGRD
jgi:hypothetical protein